MREAFGGAFLIKLLLIFLSIYIVVLGITASYAKAFRVKNQIISIIEQYEGLKNDSKKVIDSFLSNFGFYSNMTYVNTGCAQANFYHGICIERINSGGYGRNYYYRITTYIQFSDLPFIGALPVVEVSGETKTIYANR